MQKDEAEKEEEPRISGPLKTRGALGIWRVRYYWLKGKKLYVSKTNSFADHYKFIKIDDNTEIKLEDNKSQFTIETANKKIVLAGILPEVLNWVFALRTCKSTSKSYSMDQFRIISVLGRGFYGKVMLVEKLDTGKLYAIKTIHKKRILEMKQESTVQAERNLLYSLEPNPFIVRIEFAFQTAHKFYIGLEYAPGGELLHHLFNLSVLPIDDVRLYLAEIILALEHLHKNNIIYRDLKPENILLSKEGHIKLTDFGLSKQVDSENTDTFCGTAEYLAPEIVLHKPYTFKVDWWALGILTYEIMFQETPFYNENQNVMFDNILHMEPEIPKHSHKACSDLIRCLLKKNPDERPDCDQIKAHQFFHGLNWEKVLRCEIKPKDFKAVDEMDPENFCSAFTGETPQDSVLMTKDPEFQLSNFTFGPSSNESL
ncbi:AGC family protein kinase [Histomonas meleagridis]|uniref:AGC family protein kinase n=1 Tax=Histomonas meleagridis TaxID=135588 RepID=UPI00355A6C69|nr:AGC family protein kinase [Histomonas meleagridis]KAH0798967.1 AGC family protein kinase [Histomonas meleagridis]